MIVTALVVAPSALAHGTLTPVTATAGSTQSFELVVPADRLDADIVGIDLRVPPGVVVETAEARQPLWTVVWDEDVISWGGGPVDRGGAETFRFTARMPADAEVAEFELVETYDDGGSASPFPLSVAISGTETGGDDTIAVAALVIALLALVAATAALALAIAGRKSTTTDT